MKKRVLKIMSIVLFVLLSLAAVSFGIFCIISSGKIEEYRDSDGTVLENSIAEKTIVKINGADNGLIIRGKSLDNPVLLFVSSGPGTSDYFYNEAYPDMDLSDYFTVCYWDYRGMCMVYDSDIDPNTVTTEQILADTKGITDYLKNRFDKKKIYIMGFSGGTHIGLEAAVLYPDDYYAYIGMAQTVCSGADNDTLMYEFMKKTFSSRGEKRSLEKLEACVKHLDDGKVICNDWASFVYLVHDAGGGTIKDKTEFEGIIIPILKAHCYTAEEKINYIRGMKMYRTTPFYRDVMARDYRDSVKKLEIPAYFISGENDYNCPWELVRDYCADLDAPEKRFLLVKDAAHSPLWENPEPVVELMREIVNK